MTPLVATVIELPDRLRALPPRLRPLAPPLWPGLDREPTAEEADLARALFDALDLESQDWYRRSGFRLFGAP